MMAALTYERNLLFGLLALQNDFVSREELLAALSVWLQDKTKPLAEILRQRGTLDEDEWTLLAALERKHLERHGNDPGKSLAAVSSLGSARAELTNLGDAMLEQALTLVGASRRDEDSLETLPPRAGEGSREGGRFRILRPHARGGLGEVYVAYDTELGREVALKEIQGVYADDPQARQRFTLEAELTGGLEHPGVVPVYGLGQYADGRPFYAMRFIRGDSLLSAIEQFHRPAIQRDAAARTLELRKLLMRFIDVCQAIEYAHSRGVLHRDLKPGNVMIGKYGETLVVDWGLAKVIGRPEKATGAEDATLRPASGGSSAPTRVGRALGTPVFMSPEQAGGRIDELGRESDVYSLGATLYVLLTGRPPFRDDDVGQVLRQVQRGEFPNPRRLNPSIARPLESICLKAMALEPSRRYPSARELAGDIERWLADERVSAHRESLLERAGRWTRRHRSWTRAAAAALLTVTIVCAAALAAVNQARQVSETSAAAARRERIRADRNAARSGALADQEAAARRDAEAALQDAKWQHYLRHIDLAKRKCEQGDLATARDLLSACDDDLRHWEWGYLMRLSAEPPENLQFFGCSFSPDGRWLAYASGAPNVPVWDLATMQRVLVLHHGYPALHVAFNADGSKLVTGGMSGTVLVWDAATGRELQTLAAGEGGVHRLMFSSDGQRLLSASLREDEEPLAGQITIWDAQTWRNLHTFSGPIGGALHPQGRRVAWVEGELLDTLKVVDLSDGKTVWSATADEIALGLAFDAAGERLAVCDGESLVIRDAGSGEVVQKLGAGAFVTGVAFDPGGSRIAAATDGGIVMVWNLPAGDLAHTFPRAGPDVNRLAWSPGGDRLAYLGGNRTVKVWNSREGRARELPIIKHAELNGPGQRREAIAFDPQGRRLATASDDGQIEIIDLATRRTIACAGHQGAARDVAFSPSGRVLASGGRDATVRLWDPASGAEIRALRGHGREVFSIAFSPDGRRLVSSSADATVRVWDPDAGVELHQIEGNRGLGARDWANAVAYAPDGKTFATAGNSGRVKLWDARTYQEVRALVGHGRYAARSVAYSNDGRRVLSVGADGAIRLWAAASGKLLQTLMRSETAAFASALEQQLFPRKGNAASSAAFSSDDRRVVAGYGDGVVGVWDVERGEYLLSLSRTGMVDAGAADGADSPAGFGREAVRDVAFHSDGRQIAAAIGDEPLIIWEAADYLGRSPSATSPAN